MVGGIARLRLSEERRLWRMDHPHICGFDGSVNLRVSYVFPLGIVARPETGPDGSVNLMVWHCSIPGKTATDWEGGFYPMKMHFSENYPYKPPKCKFPQGFFHPNVYPSGKVRPQSILNQDHGWSPVITVKQILMGIHYLLDWPSTNYPAQIEGYNIYIQDNVEYKRRVRQQAEQYPTLF
ncbi:SUMO-conjugating enzyme SCE1-like [Solanum stenotomum]|uniref:SUMO-conjugating enzyme SCE1-like n=1 Tax=Solanum stenotomum TaxID=172797 RepID=UPI0020D0A523|nr:SUMO-conjugating enzyme SCE1-like [Solanum stenotomum]